MRLVLYALLAVAVLLLLKSVHESFKDTEYLNVFEPCECPATGTCPTACKSWESQITAIAPSTGTSRDTAAAYIPTLKAFYNTVYEPAAAKPTEAMVTAFLNSHPSTGTDPGSMKQIIMNGFHIESATGKTDTGKGLFTPSAALQPSNGRDEVYGKLNEKPEYTPADSSISTQFSEGNYAPVSQTMPTRACGVFSPPENV
jgi:hypothetical protein